MISISELAKKLSGETSVAIFCHVRPDGDAVGSACALKNVLLKAGINAQAFCDDYIPNKFIPFCGDKAFSENLDKNYSAFVAVDCAEIQRLGKFAEVFLNHKNTYNIDHHISNTRYAKVNYVCDKSANTLNVYDLAVALEVEFDSNIANLLALGLVTDTGNFTHKNVGEDALRVASNLVENGADLNAIYYENFKKQTKARAKLFGVVMSKLRYFYQDRLVIASIFQKDVLESGAHPSETEGFVDFIMGIDSVEVGATIMEMGENKYKISLRSKGANVNAVAGSFGGGGHILASGCQINGEYEEVVDKLAFAVSRELID